MPIDSSQLLASLQAYIAERATADALNASLSAQIAAYIADKQANAAALAALLARNAILEARLAAASAGKIVYVSLNGKDSDPGTIDLPVQTISKGVALAGVSGHLDIETATYTDAPLPLAGQTWFGNGVIIDGGGKPYSLTGPAGVSLFGISVKNSVFNAAQKYAIVTNENWYMANCTGQSDSGGIDVRGTAVHLLNCGATGCGQNGISGGYAINCVLTNCCSHGNGTGNFNAYNELGGGKWAKSSGCTFIACDFSGNFGVGLWFDVDDKNMTVIGGRYSLNNVGPYNSGKQVEGIRCELTSGVTISGVTAECIAGQNTAIGICNADHITLTKNSIKGQVGISTAGGRQLVTDVTATGNDIRGSIWDSTCDSADVMTKRKIVFDGNTYHPQAVGYFKFGSKTFTGLPALQSIGLEKNGKVTA